MLTSLSIERFSSDVLAVPPLCRNSDLSLSESENAKVMRYLEAGGVRTLLYGGNANFHHIPLDEYQQVLSCLQEQAGRDTLVVPSAGPTFAMMMDQAKIVRKFKFPAVMILPLQGGTTSKGVEAGVRKFVEAAGVPAILYIRQDGFIEVEEIKRLVDSQAVLGIKYAVVRPDTSNDPYLRTLCDAVDRRRIVSGIGEQPAGVHIRDFGVGGFTAGIVCVAPKLSVAMLKAIRGGDWARVEKIREACKPLEDFRSAFNPVRVLHEAVRLAGIAETGPLLPLLSNLEQKHHGHLKDLVATLLRLEPLIAG